MADDMRDQRKSILSELPDGVGFYYGFIDGDHRQINVKLACKSPEWWIAYVGGEPVAPADDPHAVLYPSKDEAEAAAITWAKANPE
jgi:hypothetical protein